MQVLSDVAAERAILAGIARYNGDAYFDIADILQPTSFTNEANRHIYSCFKHILEADAQASIDVGLIYSAARELGNSTILEKRNNAAHLQAVLDFPVLLPNVRKFAAKVRKLEIAKLLHGQLETAQEKLLDLSGTESVTHILGIAEDSIFDFSSLLNDTDTAPKRIGDGLLDYIVELGENPIQQIGISTGFPIYDKAIGGGLRDGTVNVIGARPKTGKTLYADAVGYHIAAKLGIPVLNMDTEMQMVDHQHRVLAAMTESYIFDVETGQYYQKPDKKEAILEAAKYLQDEKVPYYHRSIAGMPFEEQVAIMRRWIVKEVGVNNDGTSKPCVIIYDYLKLMSGEGISNDMKEYQLLGFMMTSLHNFTVRYNIPMLAFMQLNRDGITKESSDTASGSDRIIWLCSNFTIFKAKTDEEIAEDGPRHKYNRKLVPIVARHGGGLEDKDYINCELKGWCAKVVEGRTNFEVLSDRQTVEDGFVTETEGNGDDIPFE